MSTNQPSRRKRRNPKQNRSSAYQATHQGRFGSIELTIDVSSKGETHLNTPSGYMNALVDILARQCKLNIRIKADYPSDTGLQPFIHDLGAILGQGISRQLSKSFKEDKTVSAYWMEEDAVALAVMKPGVFSFAMGTTLDRGDLFIKKDLPFQLIEEFLYQFCRSLGVSVYLDLENGSNAHRCGIALVSALFVCIAESAGIS